MINDIRHWRIEDPSPSSALSSISPVSTRAWALLARSKDNPILQQHFLQVSGAVSMMKGLDYHHDNFMYIIEGLARGENFDESHLLHEAVAYVNRGGQFHYFAHSKFVKPRLVTVSLPKIEVLKHFRDKHGSHRSFDKRQEYDDPQLEKYMPSLFRSGEASISYPSSRCRSAIQVNLGLWLIEYFSRTGQHHKGPHKTFELAIERDHPEVMNEAYGVFENLLK